MFDRDPAEALARAFEEHVHRAPYLGDTAHLYQFKQGLHDVSVAYGSYQFVRRAELEHRVFRIELADHYPSIRWLDVLHNCRTYKNVPVIGHLWPITGGAQVIRPRAPYSFLPNYFQVHR